MDSTAQTLTIILSILIPMFGGFALLWTNLKSDISRLEGEVKSIDTKLDNLRNNVYEYIIGLSQEVAVHKEKLKSA